MLWLRVKPALARIFHKSRRKRHEKAINTDSEQSEFFRETRKRRKRPADILKYFEEFCLRCDSAGLMFVVGYDFFLPACRDTMPAGAMSLLNGPLPGPHRLPEAPNYSHIKIMSFFMNYISEIPHKKSPLWQQLCINAKTFIFFEA